jgi:hypothetical protein
MKVIDLYHHLSRAMFWDIANKKMIQGDRAVKIKQSILGKHRVGFQEPSPGLTYDVWGDGKPVMIYGNIFEI